MASSAIVPISSCLEYIRPPLDGSPESELLRQSDPLQLAGGTHRDFGEYQNLSRNLEVRQTLRGKRPQLLVAGLETLPQDHRRGHILPQHVMGHAEGDTLANGRV